MKKFYCPFCNEKLSFLDGSIVKMRGTLRSSKFDVVTNFYIPGQLGQYDALLEGDITLRDGVKVDFSCINPKCHRSFTTHYDDDLSEIKMIDDDGHEYLVVFNRIYGKHSTFVVDYKKKELESSFGEDREGYIHDFDKEGNFFGE